MAPVTREITRCGTYGSVRIVKTTGVRYDLVIGDGRQGRWVVRAAARKGYTLTPGAPTRFSGNLGRHRKCQLEIRNVAITHLGDQTSDPWTVAVTPRVPKREQRALSVSYLFDTGVELVDSAGDGWVCGSPEGGESLATVNCSYGGDGRAGAVALTVRATGGAGSPPPPSGTVSLLADGAVVDSADFDGTEG